MVTIYSVVLLGTKGVKHCDMTLEDGKLKFELLGERFVGRSRRGLSKGIDLMLYKLEKERRKEYKRKEVVLEVPLDEIKCWRVEEHTSKGIAREYKNTFLFMFRTSDGRTYRVLVSNKVFKLFIDKVVKPLKRLEIPKCKG